MLMNHLRDQTTHRIILVTQDQFDAEFDDESVDLKTWASKRKAWQDKEKEPSSKNDTFISFSEESGILLKERLRIVELSHLVKALFLKLATEYEKEAEQMAKILDGDDVRMHSTVPYEVRRLNAFVKKTWKNALVIRLDLLVMRLLGSSKRMVMKRNISRHEN